ncbi:MAG: hypothetical protein LLG13_15095 [Bacteroidales bacterium]|nr:hypothetical protein [Bacteroidales bacterium]
MMDIISQFLSELGIKSDFDSLFKGEECLLYELGGFRKFNKHKPGLNSWIKSYHFTQMIYQKTWICLNLVIKNDYNLLTLNLVKKVFRDYLKTEILIQDSNNQENLDSTTNIFYVGALYQVDIEQLDGDFVIEIIKHY